MNKTTLEKKLHSYGQEHLLCFWEEYSDEQKKAFINQIESTDFELLEGLIKKALISHGEKAHKAKMKPGDVLSMAARQKKDAAMKAKGEQLLAAGKVAAFLVAGGQGSRLGFEGPKGIFRVTPVKKKSLFQVHAEKIVAANRRYGVSIPWYIMASQSNHKDTIDFFKKNDFFGLKKSDIMFFKQDMLPAVDKDGKILLESRDRIFMSPNGHGGALKAIWDSGALEDMRSRGIEQLFYFQVDNVLTYICDPAFIGYHLAADADMSNKVVRKAYPEEKMGVICELDGQTGLVEYSDLKKEDMFATDAGGALKYWAGSIATHMISVNFIEQENAFGFRLPYHIAEKNVPFVDCSGRPHNPDGKNAYKFETFIFDALKHCRHSATIEVLREEEFSALKNDSGVDSPDTVRRDLLRLHASWLREAGIDIPVNEQGDPAVEVEISPLFAPDKETLLNRNKELPAIPGQGSIYIE